ncbi:hypothetical protein CGG98_23095, partial [Vibrio parahaemolyticus]
VKKSEFLEEKLAKSIQNECNNMSQSINHQKGQKVVYSRQILVFAHTSNVSGLLELSLFSIIERHCYILNQSVTAITHPCLREIILNRHFIQSTEHHLIHVTIKHLSANFTAHR